jgi:adenine-specific DNA methylase
MTYKKKLIEVALPLEDINRETARKKSIRHGHPSTLYLWWARRPLTACRAVLFASLVDDPSERVPELLADAGRRAAAEKELKERKKTWAELKATLDKAIAAGMKSVSDLRLQMAHVEMPPSPFRRVVVPTTNVEESQIITIGNILNKCLVFFCND